LTPLPQGSHRFEVKFDVDESGVVTATGKDLRYGRFVTTRVSIRGDFSSADMARMMESTKQAFLLADVRDGKKEESEESEKKDEESAKKE